MGAGVSVMERGTFESLGLDQKIESKDHEMIQLLSPWEQKQKKTTNRGTSHSENDTTEPQTVGPSSLQRRYNYLARSLALAIPNCLLRITEAHHFG